MVALRQKRPLDPPTYRTHGDALPLSPYVEHLSRTEKENETRRRVPLEK